MPLRIPTFPIELLPSAFARYYARGHPCPGRGAPPGVRIHDGGTRRHAFWSSLAKMTPLSPNPPGCPSIHCPREQPPQTSTGAQWSLRLSPIPAP
ncbi:hypothetical protein BD626DRAFT_488029 [Schizophyllum amplum]|uniref:Uncharacterized protein n=1 Tax=Schizophyllum amplum TaxID=97359 RepID=A0A550CK73_9AGAR|nr:hypothetical protein BD626DRAFT_488029 [Auriculariopsis ampla]